MPAGTSRLFREDLHKMIARGFIKPFRLLALVALLAAFALPAFAPARAVETGSTEITQALDWLRAQQLDNGAFSAFGGESDPGATADVVFAFAAAGVEPASVTSETGPTPIDYLNDNAQVLVETPGLAGKAALALMASGADPRNAGGTDLIAPIATGFDPETGFYAEGISNHAYTLLALSSAGAEIEPGAIDTLLAAQIEDGSWGFTGDTTPGTGDSNTTALVIQAIAALEAGDDAIVRGIDYLRSLQDESGAIAYDASTAPDLVGDANSTAVAIQAFVAAGEDPTELVNALATFQNESGAFFWQPEVPDDSLLATAQAVPALLLKPLPLQTDAGSTGEHTAGLVVRHGDGTLIYNHVTFDEETINGADLLTRSRLDATMAPFGGLGAAVCSLDGEGCPSDNCFCHSYSSPSFFWHYYVLEDDEWMEYPSGPSSRQLSDGDVDGWSWTADESELPTTSIEQIVSASGNPSWAGDDEPPEGGNTTTYLVFAGMAALVIAIGGFALARERMRTP